jgi:tetratricopeptide (TPR) repeat protein
MLELALRLGDPALVLRARSRLIVGLVRVDRWDEAREQVDVTLALLPTVSDPLARAQAASGINSYYADLGDYEQAARLSLEAAEQNALAGETALACMNKRNYGFNLAQLGRYAEALAAHSESLALAERIGDTRLRITNQFDVSYIHWCMGNAGKGREIGERLLAELRESGEDPLALANCLAVLGLILAHAEEWERAAACFTEAHALWQTHSILGSWIEVEASEARALLALGQVDEASRLAVEVWTHLRKYGSARIDYPSRVYLRLAEVAAAVDAVGFSEREALEAGHADLTARAEKIQDSELRRSFLEDEVSNRALLARRQSAGQ